MIGSTGWSYHHNNALYDRKDNVGWTFKEGDKIEVTVGLAVKPTTIRFVKLGRFYDSTFEMPLGL